MHAVAQDVKQLQPVLDVLYGEATTLVLDGHRKAADGRPAGDLELATRAYHGTPALSQYARETLATYLK